MDFELSSEQTMLKESVDRMIAQQYGAEDRKRFTSEPEGWSRQNWQQFAELGLLGLGFSEDDGGFGGGPVETMIVMEALGRGLVLEPYLGSVVLAGGILRHSQWAVRSAKIEGLVDGSALVALAHDEQSSRYELASIATKATRMGAEWRLNGKKINVACGDSAGTLFVTAHVDGEADGSVAIFSVDAGTPGLTVNPYRGIDGTRLASVELVDVAVGADALVSGAGEGLAVLERAVSDAIAALCAEAVGLMDAMLWTTVEYLKTRNQFGGPISRFQSLQHRAAEMYVATETARSMAIYAAMMAAEPNRSERLRALSMAKVQISKSSRFVGQQAVQLSGGIGVTEEYIVGQQFRRSSVIERQFGDADHHLSLLAALGKSS